MKLISIFIASLWLLLSTNCPQSKINSFRNSKCLHQIKTSTQGKFHKLLLLLREGSKKIGSFTFTTKGWGGRVAAEM